MFLILIKLKFYESINHESMNQLINVVIKFSYLSYFIDIIHKYQQTELK